MILQTPCAWVRSVPFAPFIYGLVDPNEPKHVRYVGMAGSRATRPFDHAKTARSPKTEKSYCINWIRSIQAEGREPAVLILEQLSVGFTRELLGKLECMYIQSLKEIGHKLTNLTDGGDGGSAKGRRGPNGYHHTPEAIEKLRAYRHTAEAKEAIRVTSTGRSHEVTEQGRANISHAKNGCEHTVTPAMRVKIGIGQTAAWVKKKADGFVVLEETRAKTSASGKLAWVKRREREALRTPEELARIAYERSLKPSNHKPVVQSAESNARRSASVKAAWAAKRLAKFNTLLDVELDSYDVPSMRYEDMTQ